MWPQIWLRTHVHTLMHSSSGGQDRETSKESRWQAAIYRTSGRTLTAAVLCGCDCSEQHHKSGSHLLQLLKSLLLDLALRTKGQQLGGEKEKDVGILHPSPRTASPPAPS